jgi:hypothetical protein
MGATLQALRALQDIELQIIDIRQQIARKERALQTQQRLLNSIDQTLAEQRAQLTTLQKQADAMDLDLKTRSAHVAKLRAQLNSSRTNKEYAAVLAELNTQKADETRVESTTMELLEGVDQQRTVCKETQAQRSQVEARMAEARELLDRTRESLDARLRELQQRRDEAASAIAPEVAHMFDRTSVRFEGEAMARIVRTHPRRDEFMCEGCNMSVNLERFNAVVTRDEVQTCASCGRILFVERDR